MATQFEILTPNDKPALLGLSTPEFVALSESTLRDLGYKVHAATTHEEFQNRFSQVQYQVVILEELFDCASPDENRSLRGLQWMPMNLRRHATVLLIGDPFETMHSMQAFSQSVHAVINPIELVGTLSQLVSTSVAEHVLFMNVFKETQNRIAQGKV